MLHKAEEYRKQVSQWLALPVLQPGPHKHKYDNEKENSYECNNNLLCI